MMFKLDIEEKLLSRTVCGTDTVNGRFYKLVREGNCRRGAFCGCIYLATQGLLVRPAGGPVDATFGTRSRAEGDLYVPVAVVVKEIAEDV